MMMIFRSKYAPTVICLIFCVSFCLFRSARTVEAWGRLEDIRYKLKPSDGNLWSHLTGRGRMVTGREAPGSVVITFDDGPDHRTTPVILDILDKYDYRAVFFINCHQIHHASAAAEENMAVLRDMYRRGHYIGNHTFGHLDPDTVTLEDAWHDVVHCEQLIESVTGREPTLYRPPFGKLPPQIRKRLDYSGYTTVMWNMDTQDWRYSDPAALKRRVKTIVDENGGGILLFHDTNSVVVEALDGIMQMLTQRDNENPDTSEHHIELAGIESFIQSRR